MAGSATPRHHTPLLLSLLSGIMQRKRRLMDIRSFATITRFIKSSRLAGQLFIPAITGTSKWRGIAADSRSICVVACEGAEILRAFQWMWIRCVFGYGVELVDGACVVDGAAVLFVDGVCIALDAKDPGQSYSQFSEREEKHLHH